MNRMPDCFGKGQEGSALVGAVVLLFVVTLFGGSYLSFGSFEARQFGRDYLRVKAFWKAEELLTLAHANMVSGRVNSEGTLMWTEENLQCAWRVGPDSLVNGKKIQSLCRLSARVYGSDPAASGRDSVMVEVTARELPLSASNVFMIIDSAGAPYFDTGDTVNGAIHSNTPFKITGRPVFNGEVTTGSKELFAFLPSHGYTAPAQMKSNGKVYVLDNLDEQIKKVPLQIEVPPYKIASIGFVSDGTFEIRYRDLQNPLLFSSIQVYRMSDYDGVYVLGDVEVRGTVNGVFTVGSAGNITIVDDILYADADPLTGAIAPGSGNLLGLIAQRSVKLKQDQQGLEVGKGICIDAAIVAVQGSFEVVNYKKYSNSMGTMNLWGSIVQNIRGVVGSVRLRGTQFQGYHKNWHYDPRFAETAPPYFPPLRTTTGSLSYKTLVWGRI